MVQETRRLLPQPLQGVKAFPGGSAARRGEQRRGRILILEGDRPVEIVLRRSSRSRRLSLRVSSLDGRVTLTLPNSAPLAEARAFLAEREDWVRRALAGIPEAHRVSPGTLLPFLGRMVRLETRRGRRVRLEADILHVPPARPARAAAGFMKAQARDLLAAASDRHAAMIGGRYSELALRDTRSRWGSCSADGRLMYSWRLAMAPREVLDYVAAHEVAHLVRMDHTSAFWQVVEGLCPEWRRQREWLRREGPHLHRYRFED